MRKLAPVFLISIFAIGSTTAMAMGDRKKDKAPTSSTPAATTPAPSSTTTNPAAAPPTSGSYWGSTTSSSMSPSTAHTTRPRTRTPRAPSRPR